MGPVMHEVIGPDVVGPFGAQPHTRTVIEPQPAPLRLFVRPLQPLAPPQALDPLVVDLPAGVAWQGSDSPIAVTAILSGQLDHVRDQATLVVPPPSWDGGIVISRKNISRLGALRIWLKTCNIFKRAEGNGTRLSVLR